MAVRPICTLFIGVRGVFLDVISKRHLIALVLFTHVPVRDFPHYSLQPAEGERFQIVEGERFQMSPLARSRPRAADFSGVFALEGP